MAAPHNFDELQRAIQGRLDTFAAGQQRIAELVLADPEGTAFRTVGETAKLADVHQSSVVRFAQILGLDGYPSLVDLCRQRLTSEAQLVSRFKEVEQSIDSTSVVASMLGHDQDNLIRTLTRVSTPEWEKAVESLATADRVHVMGLRECLAVADLMTYLLRLVRPKVHQVSPVVGSLVEDLRDLRAEDVFVAMSIHRYTAETVRALEHARDLGLTTIALTDTPSSPLARLADVTFQVDCEGVAVLRSVTAFIALVQALATGVALHNEQRTREQLHHDEQLLERFSVYVK